MRKGALSWKVAAITVAASALLLQGIDIPYVAHFFGAAWTTGEASLIHLQAGLLLAVGLACGDRRVLAAGFMAILLGWVVRVVMLDQWHALHAKQVVLVMANTALKFLWTERCAYWIGAPFDRERPFGVRNMPRFIGIGLLLYPLGWAGLTVVSHLLSGNPAWIYSSEAVQQFLAKHVGVTCMTLPVLLWMQRLAGVSLVRRVVAGMAWSVGLLLVAAWTDGMAATGPGAWLAWLYDYRLTIGALLAAAILLLSPVVSMPILMITHFVLLHVLAATAHRAADVGALGGLLAHVVELNVMVLLLVGVYLVNRERRDAYVRLKQAAFHDAATGLPNANALHAAWARLPEKPEGLGFLAFDHVDQLVGSYGWPAQSALLREVPAIVAPVRAYHLGGAQFVLLPNEATDAPAVDWGGLLLALQRHAFVWQGTSLHAAPYLGVAVPKLEGSDGLEAAIADACEAAMQARQRGETDPVGATEGMLDGDMSVLARRRRFSTASDAIGRIRSGHIALYMQKLVRIDGGPDGGGLSGEILCRLVGADGQLILPDRFIPELEANGHVAELDLAVVQTLFAYLHAQPGFGASVARVGINISGVSLAADSFRNRLTGLLRESPFPYDKLCFELTETAAVTRFEPAMKLFMELRALGCRVALDDFGSGMQNFERLKQMPVDSIKIDGQFVRQMSERGSDYEIVRAAVAVAKAHGLSTVAEYVEDAATDRCLRELGVNWGQGYFYARPQPLDLIWRAGGQVLTPG